MGRRWPPAGWRVIWGDMIDSAPSAALTAPPAPAPFDAVLYPNRSLPPAGFMILMLAVVSVSAAVGAGFALVGAWPVTGFLGLDVLLLFLAFRWNYREGRRTETIRLDRDGLVIRRTDPDGRVRAWRFEPYWVRVRMEGPAGRGRQLTVSSHGQSLVIGRFLTPAERSEVAQALQAALRDHRGRHG